MQFFTAQRICLGTLSAFYALLGAGIMGEEGRKGYVGLRDNRIKNIATALLFGAIVGTSFYLASDLAGRVTDYLFFPGPYNLFEKMCSLFIAAKLQIMLGMGFTIVGGGIAHYIGERTWFGRPIPPPSLLDLLTT